MSLSITSFPERTVNNNPQLVSKWSAVHHKMIFDMHRQDYFVTGSKAFKASPTLILTISGLTADASTIFTIGEEIYLEMDNGDKANFTITGVTDPNIITVNVGTVPGFGGAGYFNHLARENYFIRTNIFGVDQSNNYFFIGQSINKPDNTGRATVDVSSFLKSAVDYIDEFDYITLNKKDLTLGGSYNITFSENWIGFEGEFSGLSNTILRFYVNAAKQIQDVLGQNMGEFVPFFIDQSPELIEKGEFLSDFEEPTYFPNFPFSLSFIYSEFLAGIETFKHEEEFNVNGGSVGPEDTKELNNAEVQEVNRLTINMGYPSTTDSIQVWLETDGTINCIQYMTPDYVLIGYVEEICGLPPVDDPVEDLPVL